VFFVFFVVPNSEPDAVGRAARIDHERHEKHERCAFGALEGVQWDEEAAMDDAGVSRLQALRAQGQALIRGRALIAGEWVTGEGVIEVDDPATEEVIGTVPKLSAAQTEQAVQAASDAFPTWSGMREFERALILRRWGELVDANADALGALLALENGKPFAEAKGEIGYANQFIKWFASEAERLDGAWIPSPTAKDRILAIKQPVGPVAAITPWNFPAAMITRKVAPAFAAGCTVVLKPASATPFSALALAALALEAGVPPAAFSVVTGESGVIAKVLTSSPLMRKLSFTGSTGVGRELMASCAPSLKRLSMELGGAAPLIVFEDADLELAVAETVKGKFRCAGQTCVCPNRVYVQAPIYKAFLERLTERVAGLKVGGAFDPGAEIGPLIDAKGLAKVEDHVERTVARGGRILTGGERHPRGARFYQPTVLDGGDETLFRDEETFGPVVPVFPFKTEEEVIALANASEFGLASYLFSENLNRVMRVAQAIEAGMVGVNVGLMSNAANPFGGVKQSGFGREGSIYGIEEYLQVKAVTLGLR
jgi:succinate-semialdehyde dehydrogenase/glutarate-semialdehyde dehydrogenase